MKKSYETIPVSAARTYDSTELRRESPNDDQDKRSTAGFGNELRWHDKDETVHRLVINVFEELVEDANDPLASVSTCCLLSSKCLPLHLNAPMEKTPPPSILQQSLFFGQGLTPVLLTVYDETDIENDEDRTNVHDYAVELIQTHYRLLMSYCCCDFVVLACTIEETELCLKKLKCEIEKEKKNTRFYYSGPHKLSAEAYNNLKNGVLLLSAGTFACCLLEKDESQKPWILVMDEEQRQEVYTHLSRGISEPGPVTFNIEPSSTLKTKISILEAASRLSLWKEVTIATRDMIVKESISKFKLLFKERHGTANMRLSLDEHSTADCNKETAVILTKEPEEETDLHLPEKQDKLRRPAEQQLPVANRSTTRRGEMDANQLVERTKYVIETAKKGQQQLKKLWGEYLRTAAELFSTYMHQGHMGYVSPRIQSYQLVQERIVKKKGHIASLSQPHMNLATVGKPMSRSPSKDRRKQVHKTQTAGAAISIPSEKHRRDRIYRQRTCLGLAG